jgi:exopolysaccharide production protein ExoZ
MTDPAHSPSLIPVPRRRGELVGIQYLRGIAAMMVVVFHLKSQFARMGYVGFWPNGLSAGVDIFFVISGFIMLVTTAGKSISPFDFWWRRIIRIVPMYWLVTAFMTAVMLIVPKALQTARYEPWHLLGSYIFVPVLHPVEHKFEPLVTPGWTLNYEMFFYLIFGLFLLVPARLRFAGTVASLTVLVLVGAALMPARTSVAGFYTDTIILEFAFGMALGEIARRGDLYGRMPALLGWALLIGGLMLLVVPLPFSSDTPRALARGPFATAVVAGVLILEAHARVREMPLLRALGDASYSIYLSQLVFTSALSQAWRKVGLDQGWGGLVAFSTLDILTCALGGWLCYRLVEKPLTHLLRPRGRDGARMRADVVLAAADNTAR